jgi:hypothetical protein
MMERLGTKQFADAIRLAMVAERRVRVLDAAIDIAGTDMGNIQLLDHDAGSLIIAASRGFSAPFLSFLRASLPPTRHVAPC